MQYDNLIRELFVEFPMLKLVYEEDGEYLDVYPHGIYSIIFSPFLLEAIANNNVLLIRQACDFLEEMAVSSEKRVSDVLNVSVLETILHEREQIAILKNHLKPETAKFLMNLEKHFEY